MGFILLLSAFTKANNNLSQEFRMLDTQSVKDTIPTIENIGDMKFDESVILKSNKESGLKPLYILRNGKKEKIVSHAYFNKLDYTKVATVYVLKDKAAKKKYGKKAKNGVVIFEMKKKKNE